MSRDWPLSISRTHLLFVAKAAATVVPFLLVAIVGWQMWLYDGGVFKTSEFVVAKWLEKPAEDDIFSCYRGGMAEDILTRVLAKGMSREAVRQRLGEPDKETAGHIEYNLGFCSKLRIDLDTLDIHFSERNEIQNVRLTQH